MNVYNSTGVLKKVLLCLPTYYELVPISEVAKRHIEAGEKIDHEVVEKEYAEVVAQGFCQPDFSEKYCRPVVEVFQDLHGLFVCSKCGGMLRLATSEITPMTIRCNCGQVDWNLTKKGKTS